MEDEMTRDEAIAYLKRKKVEPTEDNIKRCMTGGKIYGDPVAVLNW